MTAWLLVLCVVIVALAYIFYNYFRVKRLKEGTAEMQEMARSSATALPPS